MKSSRALRPAVIHADRGVGKDATRLVYVGCGRNDPQQRPSVFFNPFLFLSQSDAVANEQYAQWLGVRMDLDVFLRPLLGHALLCDCDRGLGCHTHVLLRFLDRIFPLPGSCQPHFGYVDNEIVCKPVGRSPLVLPVERSWKAPLPDGDDSGAEEPVISAHSRPEDIEQVDETRRGSFNSLSFGGERPTWPSAWVGLISSIRLLGVMCFWDLFPEQRD